MTATAASAALRAFLGGLIDYAGLFPPSRLPMGTAVEEYVRHLGEPEAFMLGRFVVPSSRIGELLDRLPSPAAGRPFRLAVLAGGGPTDREALNLIRTEDEGLPDLLGGHPGRAVVEAIETRLPRETVDAEDAERVRDYADDFRAVLAGAGLKGIPVFFEAARGARWRETDRDTVAGLADAAAAEPWPHPGFKLRCGGPEPGDAPAATRVARAIAECRDRGVPLKCTAGLHRPMRHAGPEGERHGFLNLFVAAVLAAARWLPEGEIEACVLEEDATSFRFDDDALVWRARSASAAEVEKARRTLATGFGSCSFDEPRQGLRDLGFLT